MMFSLSVDLFWVVYLLATSAATGALTVVTLGCAGITDIFHCDSLRGEVRPDLPWLHATTHLG
jgi:hypothetical protein